MQNLPQFDTQSIHQKVKDFRIEMKLTISPHPRLMTWEELSFYARFINEETSELLKAHEDCNLVDAADALGDLVYLLVGASQVMGLPFDKVLSAVHKANMKKVPGASKRHRNDVAKPTDWVGPEQDIEALLLERTVPKQKQLDLFNE